MLHAKTAVADGRWARVGSSNLNLASWIGNRELDVMVDDEPFASRVAAWLAAALLFRGFTLLREHGRPSRSRNRSPGRDV